MIAPFNPYSALKAAARGDIAAQRALADHAVHIAYTEGDRAALFDGLCFARLAAAHGEMADTGRAISMLALASQMCRGTPDEDLCTPLGAEALARIAMAADADFELSNEIECGLLAAVEECTPEEAELGKCLQRMMAAAEKGN